MAGYKKPVEPPPPKLNIPLTEAEKRISEQLEKGEKLLQKAIASQSSSSAYPYNDIPNRRRPFGVPKTNPPDTECKEEWKRWRDFNTTLLATMFTSEKVSKDYSTAPIRIGNPLPDVIKADLNNLQSIFEKLALYPAPAPLLTNGSDAQKSFPQERNNRTTMPDAKKVFVVYGRNTKVYDAMRLFLQALGLEAVDFYKVKAEIGGSPFVGDIVRRGMDQAQAVIVLYTPDEFASLHTGLCKEHDSGEEKQRWQPRQNVILEAGMALGISEERTILVVFGNVSLPSDLHGRHFVRLGNSVDSRKQLRTLLKGTAVGCAVDPEKDDWHDLTMAGDFESCFKPPVLPEVSTQSPFRQ